MTNKSDLTLSIETLKSAIEANEKLSDYTFQSFFGVDFINILQMTKSDNSIVNTITAIDGLEFIENNNSFDCYGGLIAIFSKIVNELNIPDQLLIDYEEIEAILLKLEHITNPPEIGFDGTNYFVAIRYGILKG